MFMTKKKTKTITYTLENDPIKILGHFEPIPLPTFEELWDRTIIRINGKKLSGAAKQNHLKKMDQALCDYIESLEAIYGKFICNQIDK